MPRLVGGVLHSERISTLADFVSAAAALGSMNKNYWFRGHSNASWSLTPSALRPSDERTRTTALGAIDSFKRFAAMKLREAPSPQDELQWTQIARHHGLPTRLLYWTENAAISLYFASEKVEHAGEEADGLVFILDPIELNIAVDKNRPRVFDAYRDSNVILPYFDLKGRKNLNGRPSIAIDPVWNSERLVLQKGKFTLHGAREFALTKDQAPSLIALAVLREDKDRLRRELQSIGIDEMSIFPELEHVCSYICGMLNLTDG